ncbi:MAG: nucleotidyltransferase family protein [Rhodospirillales bacterium]
MILIDSTLSALADCLCPADDGEGRLAPREIDWTAVIELANRHLLGPAVYARLCKTGRDRRVPEDVLAYLAMLHELNIERNKALRRQVEEVIRTLNAAGVEPMLLKGAIALVEPFSGEDNVSTRMMRDLDILVRRDAANRSISALESLSYDVVNAHLEGYHAIADFVRMDMPGAVDLHVELIDPEYVLPAREVWQQATRLSVRGLKVFIPSPTHRMLHHLLHAQVHHLANFYRGDIVLSQLFEFTTLADRMRNRIDWQGIEACMYGHRLKSVLHSYLIAANRLFGMPWPLETSPTPAARVHFRRCLLQIKYPSLGLPTVAWGNLRAAFAWHRMRALYGTRAWLLVCQTRHLLQFMKKMPMRHIFSRMFRTE